MRIVAYTGKKTPRKITIRGCTAITIHMLFYQELALFLYTNLLPIFELINRNKTTTRYWRALIAPLLKRFPSFYFV
jgi:hypothetical protein